MKRIILSVFLLLGSVALFAATETAQNKAEVISFTGKAEYQTAQGWLPITVGTTLDQGTMISTGFKSSVVLAIGDSRFTVAALSRITIDKLTESDSNYDTEMNLSTGKLKMDVKAKPGTSTSFTVRSPTATASVRGTSGIMAATGTLQSSTGVWTMSPRRPNSKPIYVRGTQSADIPSDLVVTAPQQTATNGSSITNTATVSLATAEAVTPPSGSPTAPASDMTSVIPPVPTAPVAPVTTTSTTGTIVVNINMPN